MEQNLTLSPIRQKSKQTRAKQEVVDETPDVKEINLGFNVDPEKTYLFEIINKSAVARFENLGARAKVYDTIEKRYREIGYHPLTPTIFTEDWDESFHELPEIPLGFNRNTIEASGQDIRKIEYLMCHNLYEHSPYRVLNRPAMFTLADKDVLEAIKAKRHATEKKALDAITDADIADIRPIARVIFGITETSDTAIINALNELVKKPKQGIEPMSNAEKVLDNINNPKLNRTYNIQQGIDRGIITVDNNKGIAIMTEGGGLITRIETKNAVKELVDYSFTDDGKKFYGVLRGKI